VAPRRMYSTVHTYRRILQYILSLDEGFIDPTSRCWSEIRNVRHQLPDVASIDQHLV
jgi:hypothetical protein